MSKMMIHLFTVADYEEEEIWLRDQHKKGLKLVKTYLPCFYIFEECEPEDVVYRLDYKNEKANSNYKQMFADFGWEYFNSCMGWNYFRKPAEEMSNDVESEIFSDDLSKVEMLEHIVKTRMMPLVVIFCACLVPNWIRSIRGADDGLVIQILFTVLLCLYIYLFIHCGTKLKKLKAKYGVER